MANARSIKQERARKTRALLLSVARAELLRQGPGLTCNMFVRALNRRGKAKGTLYYHYKSWEDLKKQVVEQLVGKNPELAELQTTIEQHAVDPTARFLIEIALRKKSRSNGRRQNKRGWVS